MLKFTNLVIVIALAAFVSCGTKEEWKKRTIYQLLTDRFWRSNGDTTNCTNLSDYCGGDWKGIEDKLDYIQGMGFDAIWISPVPKNTPKGYHGYWQQDFYMMNPHFGNEKSLKNLVDAVHKRGMWIMVDCVANHVGYVPGGFDFSIINPFNKKEHYHKYCLIHNDDWGHNQWRVEHCRLANLPDLKQENPYVKKTLYSWIHNLVKKFNIDGLRIDTVEEVQKDFWKGFSDSAGVFTMGEIMDGRVKFVASYQGLVDSALNYPMFTTLGNVYAGTSTMHDMSGILNSINKYFPDPTVLGIFLDNHDVKRFLAWNPHVRRLKNGLVYIMYAEGIPIMYYGTEQYFNGDRDPYNREPLWTSMNPNTDLYKYVGKLTRWRRKYKVWSYKQIERYVDDKVYVFTKGKTFVMTTISDQQQDQRTFTNHPYQNGEKICNLFYGKNDCVTVQNGKFTVHFKNGEAKIFVPANMI